MSFVPATFTAGPQRVMDFAQAVRVVPSMLQALSLARTDSQPFVPEDGGAELIAGVT